VSLVFSPETKNLELCDVGAKADTEFKEIAAVPAIEV